MSELDWDQANIGHIARHDVTQAEVEEVFDRDPIIEHTHTAENGENRFIAHGVTAQGRYLTVAFTERNQRLRPITAFDMPRKDKKVYAPKIHKQENPKGTSSF